MKEPLRRSPRITRCSAENTKSTECSKNSAVDILHRRRKRRNSSSEERPMKLSIVSPVSSVDTIQKIHKKVVNGRIVDAYCWICHKLGYETICSYCPRVYHKACLKKWKINSLESDFCECRHISVDKSQQNIHWVPTALKPLLRCAMQEAIKEDKKNPQKIQKPENSKFCRLFKSWPEIAENGDLCQIIDLDILIDKMNDIPLYQSTAHFFADVKWIYHNCYIIYGADSDITETAQKLQKNFKQEMIDIEACQECYINKHSDNYMDFFTKLCKKPHPIVWAKLRGSPFWPAKCLNIHNGHADVRFFGTHDNSKILLNQVYRISRENPSGKEFLQSKYRDAMKELKTYICNYEKCIGQFKFYNPRTPVNESSSSTKKHHRRGKRRISHVETSKKGSSENELLDVKKVTESVKYDLDKVKGMFSHLGSERERITEPFESFLHDDSIETKVKAHLHPPEPIVKVCQNNSKNNSADVTSNVVCHMTFTADEENYPSEMNNADDFIDTTTSTYSLANTSALSSISETSHFYSDAELLPSCSGFVNSTEVAENNSGNFTSNVNTSTPFPVITSTRSAYEDRDNLLIVPTSDENSTLVTSKTLENYIKSTDPASLQLSTSSERLMANFAEGILKNATVAEDDDDEIQVVKETTKKSLADSVLKNAPLCKSLCELLLANKPTIRKNLELFQNLCLRFYIMTWLEVHSERMDDNVQKNFQMIYTKLMKKVEHLNSENSKLKKELEQLNARLKEATSKENQKYTLKNDIIRAAVNKCNSSMKDRLEFEQHQVQKMKYLEEKLRQTRVSNEQILQENETLKLKLKECCYAIEEKDKELAVYKNSHVDKNLTNSECQTDIPVENRFSENIASIGNALVPVSTYQETSQFQNLNETRFAEDFQQQQNFTQTTNVQHSSMVLIQQSMSSVPSSVSLNGTVVCETSNLLMSECSFVTPTVSAVVAAPPPLVPVPLLVAQASIPTSNKEGSTHNLNSSSLSKPKLDTKTVLKSTSVANKNSKKRKKE